MRDFLSNCATSTVQGLKSLKKKSLIKNQDTISIKNTDLRHSELRILVITVQSFRTCFGISNLANRSLSCWTCFSISNKTYYSYAKFVTLETLKLRSRIKRDSTLFRTLLLLFRVTEFLKRDSTSLRTLLLLFRVTIINFFTPISCGNLYRWRWFYRLI